MPIFLDLFVLIVIFLLGLFAWTQILRPWIAGEPLFPFFRWSNTAEDIRIVQTQLEQKAEEIRLAELREELNRRIETLKEQK